MENPYLTPESNIEKRVFKTPIIVPISVIAVILIYGGYWLLFLSDSQAGILEQMVSISFEVFLLCEIAIVTTTLYNKSLLQSFLSKFSVIDSQNALTALKPIIRTNMYSSLLVFGFLILGSLTAVMTILNYGIVKGLVVAILTMLAAGLMRLYNPLEKKLKHIDCNDETLEPELNHMLQSWQNKAFPDF